MQNSVLTTKLLLTGHSSAARQSQTSFWVFLYSFSYCGWWVGGHGKYVEIDESFFSSSKCICGRLCETVWVFVDVERELGTPVLHLSLTATPRHCLPSLRLVSYPSLQSSVTAVGTTFISTMKESHTTLSIALSILWCTKAHRNTFEATSNHVKVHLRPDWENEVKCVINRFMVSLSAEFDDVPTGNVKRCV